MRQYHDLLRRALEEGLGKADRVGAPAMGGHGMRFGLDQRAAPAFALIARREAVLAQHRRGE